MNEYVSLADWNIFVSSMLAGIFVLGTLIWAIDSHCGSDCAKCRPAPERKHK